jgi:hypothetical protein
MKKVIKKKDDDLSIDLILELHSIAMYMAIDNKAVSGELRPDNTLTVGNIYHEVAHEPPC